MWRGSRSDNDEAEELVAQAQSDTVTVRKLPGTRTTVVKPRSAKDTALIDHLHGTEQPHYLFHSTVDTPRKHQRPTVTSDAKFGAAGGLAHCLVITDQRILIFSASDGEHSQ
jgi:hypothetical protein